MVRSQWDSEDFERRFHGSRSRLAENASASEIETEQHRQEHLADLEALSTVLPPHVFFEGPSAALLHGVPLPNAQLRIAHLGVLRPARASRHPGSHSRSFIPVLLSFIPGERRPVLDAPSTWACLGRYLYLEDLVAAADHLLWREPEPPPGSSRRPRPAQHTQADLRSVLQRGRWWGGAKLREALALSSTSSASPAETFFRLSLLEAGLPLPELNVDIFDDGRWLGNVDFVYRAFKVCIEYQSEYHFEKEQFARDRVRISQLEEAGWIVIEISKEDGLRHPLRGIRRVRGALTKRGWKP